MIDWQTIGYALIMFLIIGPAVGNYATSVVYRLPRSQTPFEKHPYCGNCGTMLTPKDLFPLLSYLMLRGKCRYCGINIRFSYAAIELACGVIFALNFLLLGISEDFILVTAIGVFFTILCGLEYHERKLFPLILTYLFALGAVLRVLHEHSIYPFFASGFALLLVGAVIWRAGLLLNSKHREKTESINPSGVASTPKMPEWLWLMTLIGVLLPIPLAVCIAAVALILYALQRFITHSMVQSMAATFATYGGMLWWLLA